MAYCSIINRMQFHESLQHNILKKIIIVSREKKMVNSKNSENENFAEETKVFIGDLLCVFCFINGKKPPIFSICIRSENIQKKEHYGSLSPYPQPALFSRSPPLKIIFPFGVSNYLFDYPTFAARINPYTETCIHAISVIAS